MSFPFLTMFPSNLLQKISRDFHAAIVKPEACRLCTFLQGFSKVHLNSKKTKKSFGPGKSVKYTGTR